MAQKRKKPRPGGGAARESARLGSCERASDTTPQTHPQRTWPARIHSAQHVSAVAREIIDRLRFERRVEHLHILGPRAVGELLRELVGGDPQRADDLDLLLAHYARLDPEIVRALGGDRFPSRLLILIDGGRS